MKSRVQHELVGIEHTGDTALRPFRYSARAGCGNPCVVVRVSNCTSIKLSKIHWSIICSTSNLPRIWFKSRNTGAFSTLHCRCYR